MRAYAVLCMFSYIGDCAGGGRSGPQRLSAKSQASQTLLNVAGAPAFFCCGATRAMTKFELFLPLAKVDVDQRLVVGVATAEVPDRAGEICDYASTKPYFEAWSAELPV